MHREFIKNLTNIVEANLANESYGTEDLAKEAGISHSNLNRKLKIISNQNISQFIREVRLKKAKDLLLNEETTVAEIAYRVGFGSATYFNNCFREYFGVAPGELRKRESETDPEIISDVNIPTRKVWKNVLAGIIIGLLILMSVGYFLIQRVGFSDVVEDKSIAVLPFKNLSDDANKQYFADGMMEEILNHLNQIGELRVISRTSVEQFRGNTAPAQKIAKKLGVNYILEGSVMLYGERSG